METKFSDSLPPNFFIEPTGELKKLSFSEKIAINKDLAQFLDRNKSKFKEAHLHVHIKEHKEKFRETPSMYCILKLSTDRGMFHSSDHGWGSEHAVNNALTDLDFQIEKKFGKMAAKTTIRGRPINSIVE